MTFLLLGIVPGYAMRSLLPHLRQHPSVALRVVRAGETPMFSAEEVQRLRGREEARRGCKLASRRIA